MIDVGLQGLRYVLEGKMTRFRDGDHQAECKFIVMVTGPLVNENSSEEDLPYKLEDFSGDLNRLVKELSSEIEWNRSYDSDLPFSLDRYNVSENVAYYTIVVYFELSS
jgi:hypothetical protein